MRSRLKDGSSERVMLLVLVCFFLSGVTGLIYEILWTRMLVKVIGGAPFAISIILTIFMGGLGLGSYLASRRIDRIKEPLRLVRIYGLLQLAIGAYGLAVPFLLAVFRPVYAIIYNRLFSHFMLYSFLTFVGCSLLLVVPVICMGATLPILCRFYVTKLSHLGTHAGRLYGLNTIGAALGALLSGFWLINLFGMTGTLIFAVLVNGIIGLSCITAGRKTKRQRVVSELKETRQEDSGQGATLSEYPGAVIGALLIFAVSGFCAMSYEVIWTKLLGLIVGPTTYSFTIVLVTFILGLALGSMIFGWLGDKTGKPLWLLLSTQIAAALFVLGVSHLIGNSQLFFAKVLFTFREQFAFLSVSKAVIIFCFMILPTLCLGATFPLVGKIYTQTVSKVGRSIGVAYAINTIGAVLGSFCAGFVLIPLVGKENGLSLVIGLQLLTSLVVGVIILGKGKKNILRLIPLAAPALAGLFLCFYFPVWNHLLLSRGKYHRFEEMKVDVKSYGWLEALLHGPEILTKFERHELVYYGDGIGGFTTVLKYADPLGSIGYSMANSGKADASSRADMKTQTLLAHFPMLFHRDPKTVMVLGLASGITAGEVLHYPIEQLDVLDINREVVEASNFFLPWNNNVLSDPKTNLIIQDARAHLQLTKEKYDVIISEPSNPWMAGLATLFTRDFFAFAEEKLNEDGIFVQWVHSYQMDWFTFALVGRTFAQIFPNSLLVLTEPSNIGNDYLLVGVKGKDRLVLENAERKLSCIQQSKNVALSDPKLLYRLIVSEDLQRLFGPGPINTDSRPRLEFAAPKLMYHSGPMIMRNIQSKKWLTPETRNTIQQVTTGVDAQIDFAAYALSIYLPFRDMVDLSKATPSQKERFFKLMETYCADNSVDFAIFKNDELKQRCRSVQIEAIESRIALMPDKAASYFYLADLYFEKGMLDEAVANCSKALRIEPDFAEAHYNLGLALTDQDRLDEAITHFTEAIQIDPYNAEV
ncbi:MAG: fused MFS/spermidine synthase, partial [Planctomycetota bacterium]